MPDDDRPTVDEKRGSRPRSEPGPSVDGTEPSATDTAPRYVLGAEIARGGMGRVVEATDTVLGRTVAVKAALATDPEALRRFRRETNITARLEHPSIVPVHDAGTNPDGSPFYVMRRVSGRPLDRIVAAAMTLAERLALVPHVVAAAQAVGHAHRRGVIHRDIKPSNILVGDLGETVVIDWGLAKVIDEPDDDDPHARPALDAGASLRTRVGTVFGTPGFMSPEQLRGEPVDARSDVYAIGATLYFLLAGLPPHSAESEDEMMVAAAAGPPVPIGARVSGIPPELSTIVDKSLAYDDDVRYADAAALAEDLQRFLTGQLVASHRYSTRERVMRLVRRHRISFAIAAIALVGFIGGGWLAIHRIVAERDRANARQHEAEQSRQHDVERADQLVLLQARTVSATNPTEAIATLKQLRNTPERWQKLWRSARDIAEGARRAGVTWGFAGPQVSTSIGIAPGGTRALVAGLDGIVRILELAGHTEHDLTTCRPDCNAVFASDDVVVTYRDSQVSVFDVRTGVHRDLTLATDVHQLVAGSSTMVWVDRNQTLWRAAIAGGPPERIAVPALGTINNLELSPDRRSTLVAADAGVVLIELDRGTAKLVAVGEAEGPMGWRRDSRAFAVALSHKVDQMNLDGTLIRSYASSTFVVAIAFGKDDVLFAMTTDGLMRGTGSTLVPYSRAPGVSNELGRLTLGYGSDLIGGTRDKLSVIGPTGTLTLDTPIEGVVHTASTPNSPYVVAALAGRILVWNVRDLEPTETKLANVAQFTFIGSHDVVSNHEMLGWTWTDLDTGQGYEIAGLPPMIAAVLAVSNTTMVAVIGADRTAFVIRKGAPAEPIRDHVHDVALANNVVMLELDDGALVTYDLATKTSTTLIERGPELAAIGWTDGWFAATFVDGVVWRRDRRTGAEQRVKVGSPDPLSSFWIADDGAIYLAAGNKIVCWRADRRIADHATLPGPIQLVTHAGAAFIVVTRDGAGYLVDLGQPDHLVAQFPAGTRTIATARDTSLIATLSDRGRVTLIDVRANESWPLCAPSHSKVGTLDVTTDGSRIATVVDSTLWIWQVGLPDTAEATSAWLDRLTNATSELGTQALTWQPQAAP